MKNVIVFKLGRDRFAIELRWIREVFTLHHVTPVPHSPPAIAGVVNFRGAIMPVLDLRVSLAAAATATANRGDSAILIVVEGIHAALRIGGVDEVSTLRTKPDSTTLTDSRGRDVPLLDPPEIISSVVESVNAQPGLEALTSDGAPFE